MPFRLHGKGAPRHIEHLLPQQAECGGPRHRVFAHIHLDLFGVKHPCRLVPAAGRELPGMDHVRRFTRLLDLVAGHIKTAHPGEDAPVFYRAPLRREVERHLFGEDRVGLVLERDVPFGKGVLGGLVVKDEVCGQLLRPLFHLHVPFGRVDVLYLVVSKLAGADIYGA